MDNLGSHKVQGVRQAIRTLLDSFTPTECANYIRHCGYGQLE